MSKPRRIWPYVTAVLIGIVVLALFAFNTFYVPQCITCDEYYADPAKEMEPVPETTLPGNPG